ncbi:MAG: superoxide dismutase family protein [Myxococcota bacterium]
MLTVLAALALQACGIPNNGTTPELQPATRSDQLEDRTPTPAPADLRDAARYLEEGAVEGPLIATVTGTADHADVRGRVTLTPRGSEVVLTADIDGLPPGPHAFHVHVRGDCSDPAGGSAGGHLSFAQLPREAGSEPPQTEIGTAVAPSGAPPAGPPPARDPRETPGVVAVDRGDGQELAVRRPSPDSKVEGDLGELVPGPDGRAELSDVVVTGLPASAVGKLQGRAVVVHADGNDPTAADGSAGTPIACGVLVLPRS